MGVLGVVCLGAGLCHGATFVPSSMVFSMSFKPPLDRPVGSTDVMGLASQ